MLVLKFLNEGDSIKDINQTFIVLIPKVKNAVCMAYFTLISPCNVSYKIVAKALVNRLKLVLPHVIDEAQSGFVPGRLITDNVVVAFEAFHWLQKGRNIVGKFMAVKLDMSEAYI